MLLAYLTLDEVNQYLAQRIADRHGIGLDLLTFRDAAPAGQFDAVLYDLDSLPVDHLRMVLKTLLQADPTEPVAVHSYNLSPRQTRALRRRGVLVARRLTANLFRSLSLTVAARCRTAAITQPAIQGDL